MAATITILGPCGPGQSVRERELQSASIRSHTGRVSSAQAEVTKWAKKTKATQDLASRSGRQRRLHRSNGLPPVSTKRAFQDEFNFAVGHQSPQTFLGQGQVDPFGSDDLQKLPSVARECLEYTFLTVWPKNSPGLAKAALHNHIIQCRRLAVHSPLQFHTQVVVAMSVCYSASKEPQVSQTLLLTRLKHQTAVLSILRASIVNLTGPPSDELIDCLCRLAAIGGDLSSTGFVSRYRQTPMADALPIREFGSFLPCIPHYDALSFLVRQRGTLESIVPAVSHALSL
ncbi:hypothetical protein H2200_007673 [Cladophialophora chaetospira]|uniref:Uncharacterized protein n=1 Tax=Cladophialophora chaetospira TaxID=386627 RepID=A0AA38X674_9EURO|nr:hypothetical protein H2200_007673 [Cladophialophora chaetospira]